MILGALDPLRDEAVRYFVANANSEVYDQAVRSLEITISRRLMKALALVALTALTACEAPTPTAPSPPAPSNQIVVQSMSPSSGATLPVDKCRYYPSSFNLDFWEMCADGLRLRFDVEFEAHVTNAVITAGFYSGSQRCGLATSQTAPVVPGSRTAFEATVILLSDESVPLICAVPAETSRMLVQLWERSRPATPLLTREFAHSYRFSLQ